jgi:uncharacterized protein (DUF736 family)
MPKNKLAGALWENTNERGKFFVGRVTVGGQQVEIVVVVNKQKTNKNHPDFEIYQKLN